MEKLKITKPTGDKYDPGKQVKKATKDTKVATTEKVVENILSE